EVMQPDVVLAVRQGQQRQQVAEGDRHGGRWHLGGVLRLCGGDIDSQGCGHCAGPPGRSASVHTMHSPYRHSAAFRANDSAEKGAFVRWRGRADRRILNRMSTTFAVLGDGAWGTALAILLSARADHRVRLWSARWEN